MIKANRDKLNDFLKSSSDETPSNIGSDTQFIESEGEGFVSPDFMGGFGQILTQINELLNNPIVQNVVLGNTSQKADFTTTTQPAPTPQPPSEPKFRPQNKEENTLNPDTKADLQSHLIFTSLIQNINYQIDNNAVFTDLKDLKKEVLASETGIKENVKKLLLVKDNNLQKMKQGKEKAKKSDEKPEKETQTNLKNKGDIYA